MVFRPDNFTEQAQQVLQNSQEMVGRYKHSQWDVEHILMALLGFQAPKGGRLPVGVKYDTLVAMNDVLSAEISAETTSMITSRIVELQASRRLSTGKVSATPESIISAI